jgi:hypothetical protein
MMKLLVCRKSNGDIASAKAGVKRSASVIRDQRDPQKVPTTANAWLPCQLLNVPEP